MKQNTTNMLQLYYQTILQHNFAQNFHVNYPWIKILKLNKVNKTYNNMNARQKFRSQRTPKPTQKTAGSHIVQQTLQKKGQLIQKYQTQIQGLLQRIDGKQAQRNATLNVKSARNRAISSIKKSQGIDTRQYYGSKDYQKLILGLEYTLEMQRKKTEDLQNKNNSLETQIANLRNLLIGPDAVKQYQKTIVKQAQQKIENLQQRIVEQKKNYDFIIDSKNEAISNLQAQMRSMRINIIKQTKQKEADSISKRFLQLVQHNQQLMASINRKNIIIQKLKYSKEGDSDTDEEDVRQVHKAQKLSFYLQQLQISNKLILRKNVELLTISKKIALNEEVIKIMELYLDRKQVKGVDLNILEHPCVNKLRILLRQKAVFERQLLSQLGEHNKKISLFENQIQSREKSSTTKLEEAITDNRRLASLVASLQSNIANLQRNSQQLNRDNEILKAQLELEKKKFVDQVKNLKGELGNISQVTKQQFDRMKIQNFKLAEQNRSLLFLVGQKQKEIMKKGQAIKTFEQYREKINSLDVGETQKTKIHSVASDQPQIGSKLMLISNFSTWLFQWNKLKNWNNKKVLLNLILDKEQIRTDSLISLNYLINVIHQTILQSKNSEIQQRGIILLSYYLPQNILKNKDLYLNKIVPVIIRGFRGKIQNEDEMLHKLLNDSTLRISDQLQKMQYKWNFEMTNQMLAVNGLKYLFQILNNSHIEDQVQRAFNTLNLIARANEMISFMVSFNVTQFLLSNLKADYSFIIFSLILMRTLLQSEDYIKAQKSIMQFRKLFNILKDDDDEQLVELVLDCILLLINNSVFVKSLNKIECMSILAHTINNQKNYNPLKKAGNIYIQVVSNLENQNILKFQRVELEKLLQIIRSKRVNELRFNRALRIVRDITQIFNENELDEKVFLACLPLYETYESVQASSRIKLNNTINFIFDRNKELLAKYGTSEIIQNFVEAYKVSTNNDQMIFLLKILFFFGQQKKSTQIIRHGQESLLTKLIDDSTTPDYNVNIIALKNLVILSREKFIEKFINKIMISKIIGKVLNERSQEQHLQLTLSALYFMSKNQELSNLVVDCGVVAKVCSVILQRHDKETVIFKCFALLQVCHTNNYKRKILNHILANDPNLQIVKTINYILRKNKNKIDLASRAVFIYQFLNNRSSLESFAILVERNTWMVEDLVRLRNDFINKLDALVYKIQLLLHQLSQSSQKIAKIYQSFKVQGEQSQEDN